MLWLYTKLHGHEQAQFSNTSISFQYSICGKTRGVSNVFLRIQRGSTPHRGVARVFGARGADFRLAPPPRRPLPGAPSPVPPPPKKILIHKNLRNRLNFSQNLAIKKQIKVLVGRFLVVGDHLDPKFPYFWKIVSVFCQYGGAKTSINNDVFGKPTKIIL